MRVMGAPVMPPLPDWGYVGTQAVDHIIPLTKDVMPGAIILGPVRERVNHRARPGHSLDAKDAALWTQEFSDVYAGDDYRRFAALGVSVLDAAHAAAGRERADYETRQEVGKVSVITNVAIEASYDLLAGHPLAGYGTEQLDAMVDAAGNVLLTGEYQSGGSRIENAVYAGFKTVNYRTIQNAIGRGERSTSDMRAVQRAEMQVAWDPLAATIKQAHHPTPSAETSDEAYERLLQQARDLGSGVFGLTATAADILDWRSNISFDSTVAAFRELGAGGMILLQLSTLPKDLRSGAQTVFTDAVRRAGPDGITGKFMKELRESAFDEANVNFATIREVATNAKQADIVGTMRTEMQGKLVYNTLMQNRHLVTAKFIRRILQAQPQAY